MPGKKSEKAIFSELIGIEALESPRLEYVRASWLAELMRARARARRNRLGFKLARLVAVAGALTLPVFASLNIADEKDPWIPTVTLTISILVALATALLQVFRFGSEWRIDEDYAFVLEAEGWAYLEHAGGYRTRTYPQGAFEDFFVAVEALRKARAERRSKEIMEMAAEAAREIKAGRDEQAADADGVGVDRAPKPPEAEIRE